MPLTDSQLASIERRYSERRFRNTALLEERTARVRSELPELLRLEEEIAALSLSEAKRRLAGEAAASDAADFEASVNERKTRRLQVLTDAGYPADYLEPIYDCPDCRDTGYVNGRKCRCFRRMAADLLYERAGLDKSGEADFDHFSLSYYSPNFIDDETGQNARLAAEETLAAARAFADRFPGTTEDFPNLLLYGDTGLGKTFLSNCIARSILDRGYSVIYTNAGEFFDRIANDRFSYEKRENCLDDYLNCDLLILDDLGTELNNTFVGNAFFSCVDGRLRRGKPMIISTNLSIGQLSDRYSTRTFSRLLSNYTVRKLSGDDIRMQKKLYSQQNPS